MTFTRATEALDHYAEQLAQLKGVTTLGTMVQKAKQLQSFFDRELWPIVTQLELPQQQSQWHSATTELHRHMRLLAVEISFIQAARQEHTRQQRLEQIEHRLGQLQGFTQVMVAFLSDLQP
ncbi:MAG: heterocyst frequency control protein PatD [Cyanobacteria bacterium J06627_3]